MKTTHYDVAVVGAGSAGVAAAISAAKNGAKTILIESSSVIGGDLISGLPIDGCRSSCGEWVIGGFAKELFDQCDEFHGYIGSIYDRRNIWVVMVHPGVMGFSLLKLMRKYGLTLMPYTQVIGVEKENERITALLTVNKAVHERITADVFIDCSGDGDVAVMAGAPFEVGDETGELQPVSIVFQMQNIDSMHLLEFVRDFPENCGLGENPFLKKTPEELALELYNEGIPKVFFTSKGPLLKKAIDEGDMFPCSMLAITPNSKDLRNVTINTTRIVIDDCTDALLLGKAFLDLTEQVELAVKFLINHIPGFKNANFNGMAPRLGVRESRRIMGESVIKMEDVVQSKKRTDGVCKGAHEVDVHGKDEKHIRYTIQNGGSYDIPFGCFIPLHTENLLIAGRCLSSDRVANSSARVMGTCMGMGQAVGTAAALCVRNKQTPRSLSVNLLQEVLKTQGVILDGTK